jgi:hypothetical protein
MVYAAKLTDSQCTSCFCVTGGTHTSFIMTAGGLDQAPVGPVSSCEAETRFTGRSVCTERSEANRGVLLPLPGWLCHTCIHAWLKIEPVVTIYDEFCADCWVRHGILESKAGSRFVGISVVYHSGDDRCNARKISPPVTSVRFRVLIKTRRIYKTIILPVVLYGCETWVSNIKGGT